MNFFEHQDVARKKTGRLVFLFCLGVLGVMAAVYAVVVAVVLLSTKEKGVELSPSDWFRPELIFVVGMGVTMVVGGGAGLKMVELAGGGQTVAHELGGRRLQPDSTDPLERKVLNIVEEMSIASGVPLPPVFIMDDEDGINAFAAGYSPNDAVVAVTRGCVEKLSRDELQGVIAHEFSHILNGDMRLNIRLIVALHGILIIGMLGYWLFRVALYSGPSRRDDDKGNPAALLGFAGVAFIVIGSIGTFFGSLIKAAVSRQREYLADSSAVQFTRNPDGIAGALKKIGGFGRGSKIRSANAAEASHMFFASGLNSWFATHPPIVDRIQRIDPQFNGELPPVDANLIDYSGTGISGFGSSMGTSIPAADPRRSRFPSVRPRAVEAATLGAAVSQIGQPTEEHVQYARTLIDSFPAPLAAAAHEAYSARMVMYALLIGREEDVRAAQLALLARDGDPGVLKTTQSLLPYVDALEREQRLPIVDVTIGALTGLSARQFDAFTATVDALIDADSKLTVFEWMIRKIISKRLEPHFRPTPPATLVNLPLPQLVSDCEILLSLLAHASGGSAEASFAAGAARLPNPRPQKLLPIADCSPQKAEQALNDLGRTFPRVRQVVVGACAACIEADAEVTAPEQELLRAVCAALDCPLPPILVGQQPA